MLIGVLKILKISADDKKTILRNQHFFVFCHVIMRAFEYFISLKALYLEKKLPTSIIFTETGVLWLFLI